jgi:hypothetical protein
VFRRDAKQEPALRRGHQIVAQLRLRHRDVGIRS